MLRLLLIGLALFLLYQWLRGKFLYPSAPPKTKDGGRLIACARCGTWIGADGAVRRGDEAFCSRDCADAPPGT